MVAYICIDIGGTAIKYGVLEKNSQSRGEPGFRETGSLPTPAGGGPEIMETVCRLAVTFRDKYPDSRAVCVSTTGIVDSESGVILEENEDMVPAYTGMPVAERITAACGLPCHVENDVKCAALAEYHSGAAKGFSTSLTLTVGTGIGGAFIEDGRLLKGHTFSACEVGYMHMAGGSFEELAATSALVAATARQLGVPEQELSGKWIFEQARQGNPVCRERIAGLCDVLARGMANLCYVLNPRVIVLGGGISAQEEYLRPLLEEGLDRYLIPAVREKTSLRFAQHRNHAGMIGACYAYGIQE